MNKDFFLDDTEILAVQMFVENDKQREAIKKILLWEIYQNGVVKKGEKPNTDMNSFYGLAMNQTDPEAVGKRAMAMAEGLNFLRSGFLKLESYRKVKKGEEKKENPAR